LDNLVIPASVEVIGTKAFHNCKSLESVTFQAQNNLRAVGQDAFHECLCSDRLQLPAVVAEEGQKGNCEVF
jgi:hypothetical protein